MLNLGPSYTRILTDPKIHDPNNFIYMVKGLGAGDWEKQEFIDSKISQIGSPMTCIAAR